jgi:hypothetical protein
VRDGTRVVERHGIRLGAADVDPDPHAVRALVLRALMVRALMVRATTPRALMLRAA